ncbi:DNA topoisomerase I [Candidatus Woesearchaeota archaeon]|nr:DNA topoisomerase I [Candidatus Woesearchaeota archaeon]
MMELIITEKPSSAEKVAFALADTKPSKKKNKQCSYYELKHNNKNIIVTSAVGHLYGLTEKNKEGWSYPVFEVAWTPTYLTSKESGYVKDYIDTIAMLAAKADEFTIACDYDIEGEVIGLNVIRFACKKKDSNRMKFSTLTKGDLVEAYDQKSKHLDWGQANAGETRHKLDWFYGINLSRALTSSVKAAGSFKVMSIGRVQGPALHMLVEKEKEIQAFKAEPFWRLSFQGKHKASPLEAWHKEDRIFDQEKVKKIFSKIKNEKEAVIQEVNKSVRNQSPPTPFNLTDLQTESYALFKITPKETLAIAQSLYLAGVTSYPRTSSQQLDPKLGFKKILTDLAKQPYYQKLVQELLKEKELKPNNGSKTDPAHPAIYPTGHVPGNLKPRDQKVYDLIVKRFMATFAQPAVRETMTVLFDVKGEPFLTKGTRTLEENWHKFYKPYLKVEDITLPEMKKDEIAHITKIEKHDEETQPPARYNQSSIIKELEKRNLGTKATRAEILDTLFRRGYVEGVKITVTQLGMETDKILVKYAHTIIDEKLTADFEEDMEKIREGKQKPETVLEKAKKFLTALLTDFKKKEKLIGKEILVSIRETSDAANFMGHCPNCKDGKLMVRRGKFGRFIGCDKYPDCKTLFNIPKSGPIKFTGNMDEKSKNPVVEVGSGRSRRTVSLQQHEDQSKTHKKKYSEEGMTCPTCKEGKMILRKSFYGEFLGCDHYPKCQTMMKIHEGKVDVKNPVVKNPVVKNAAQPEVKSDKKVDEKSADKEVKRKKG